MASAFNPDDPNYKCCCGSCEAKNGGFILSVVEVVVGALAFLGGIITAATGNPYALGNMFNGALSVVCGCLGIVGIKKDNSTLLLIDYIIHIINVVVTALSTIFGAILVIGAFTFIAVAATAGQTEDVAKAAFIALAFAVLAASLIGLAIETWFMLIVKGVYHYVRDQNAAGGNYGGGGVVYGQPVVMQAPPQGQTAPYPTTAPAGHATGPPTY